MKNKLQNMITKISMICLFVFAFLLVPHVVRADNIATGTQIQVDDTIIFSTRNGAEIGTVDNVTYDEASKTLTLDSAELKRISVTDAEVTIVLKGDSTIHNTLELYSTNATIIGDGNLTILGEEITFDKGASFLIHGSEVDVKNYNHLNINITGTITSMKGLGGFYDPVDEEGFAPIKLGENVTIQEGGIIHIESEGSYVAYIGGEDITADQRDTVKVVISGTKVEVPDDEPTEDENKTVLTNNGTEFVSKETLPEEYTLEVEDLLANVTEEEAKKVTDSVKNSTLLLLQDISVYQDGEKVTMENGEYTIRFKLTSEQLKKYEKFVAVYMEDGEVKDTFETRIDGEYVEFTTTHLSEYGLLGVEEQSPSTGDSVLGNIVMLGLGALVLGATTVAMKKRLQG